MKEARIETLPAAALASNREASAPSKPVGGIGGAIRRFTLSLRSTFYRKTTSVENELRRVGDCAAFALVFGP